jgi:hypothetical protein
MHSTIHECIDPEQLYKYYTKILFTAVHKYRATKLICNRVIHGFESVCLAIDMSKSNLCFKLCLLERGVQVTTYDFEFMDNSITN